MALQMTAVPQVYTAIPQIYEAPPLLMLLFCGLLLLGAGTVRSRADTTGRWIIGEV